MPIGTPEADTLLARYGVIILMIPLNHPPPPRTPYSATFRSVLFHAVKSGKCPRK